MTDRTDAPDRPGPFGRDITLVGGGGHIGLPLALAFAEVGLKTVIYDIDRARVDTIRSGSMPFFEERAPELLKAMLESAAWRSTTRRRRCRSRSSSSSSSGRPWTST